MLRPLPPDPQRRAARLRGACGRPALKTGAAPPCSSFKNIRRLLCRRCWRCAGAAAQAAVPIEHWTLPSGAKIYLAATNALPIVDVQIDFDAGSRRDPPAQAGLAGVTAGMVEKGIRANGSDPAHGPERAGRSLGRSGRQLRRQRRRRPHELLAAHAVRAGAAATRRCSSRRARSASRPSPRTSGSASASASNASIREANTKPATIAGARLLAGRVRRPSLRARTRPRPRWRASTPPRCASATSS